MCNIEKYIKQVKEIAKKVNSLKELDSVEQQTELIDSIIQTFLVLGVEAQNELMEVLTGLEVKEPESDIPDEESEPELPKDKEEKDKGVKKSE